MTSLMCPMYGSYIELKLSSIMAITTSQNAKVDEPHTTTDRSIFQSMPHRSEHHKTGQDHKAVIRDGPVKRDPEAVSSLPRVFHHPPVLALRPKLVMSDPVAPSSINKSFRES